MRSPASGGSGVTFKGIATRMLESIKLTKILKKGKS